MMSILKIFILDSIIILGCFSGCTNSAKSDQTLNMQNKNIQSEDAQSNHSTQMIRATDDEIIKLVDSFVGGDFKALEEAETKLKSYPRQELIERLLRILQSLPAVSHRQVSVAFVLCELNYDYETNKQVLISDFNKEPHQQNLNADWEAWLINRLIRRGDKSLLSVLFSSIKWSDGGMTSALSGMMVEHLRDNTDDFLVALVATDNDTRRGVYMLIYAEDLDANELVKIKKHLSSVSSDSATSAIARDLLKVLSKGR